jgi:FkbM family methyltransferase
MKLDRNEKYVIFDIGSRDCMQSIEFINAFPNSRVYAFECNPNTLDICRKNIEPYSDRIHLIEGAVCDYDGEITFYPINQQKTITTWEDGNPGASSLFKSNGRYTYEMYVQDEIRTNCHRLDTVMENNNIPSVDIIWMDLQGAELLALRGLGDKLNDVKYIHTEMTYTPMYEGQVLFDELHKYIVSYGFEVKNRLQYRGWQEDAIYAKIVQRTRNMHFLDKYR